MKHIALRSKSIRSGDRPYTTPGVGDRLQSVLCAYQYGKAYNTPVTIHITDDKWSVAGGVKSDKKKKSWSEILTLFPKDSVQIKNWPIENVPENDWISYLKENNIDAEIYYFQDTICKLSKEDVLKLCYQYYYNYYHLNIR